MSKKLKSEKGFALILVLMLLAAMMAIGTAALMTSNTDMLIARNEKEAKKAFYLAEAGIEEALGRMDLSQSNARFMGEKKAQKKTRVGADGLPNTSDDGTPVFDGSANSFFDSSDLNVPGIGGKYDVTITYARESSDAWCNQNPAAPVNCNNEIVLYGTFFGFSGNGVPIGNGFVPVYRIDSKGTTKTGTEASVRVYVTPSSLNVMPPAGDIYSNTSVSVMPPKEIDGAVATYTGDVSGCTGPPCSIAPYSGEKVDMTKYLGVDLASMPSYADSPSPYYVPPGGQTNFFPGNYPGNQWGIMCSDSLTDMDAHLCDHDPKVIYIDAPEAAPGVYGTAKVAASSAGRGLLVVNGNLELAGDLQWEGSIYVMGKLKGNGNITCFGTMMIDDATEFHGSVTVKGSTKIGSDVMGTLGVPKYLRWVRR